MESCVACGCTDDHACVGPDGQTCSWSSRAPAMALCSFCVENMRAEEEAAPAAAPAAPLLYDAYGAPVVW